MLVTVLYRECGLAGDDDKVNSTEQYNNAFQFQHSGARVTLGDLVRAFPLGPNYHFDVVIRRNGVAAFESVHELDLASPLPITPDGVVTCRVFQLGCPPRYASGGAGKMLGAVGGGGGGGGGSFGGEFEGGSGDRRPAVPGSANLGAGGAAGQGAGNVMKELSKGAGKATKGLLGFVGHAVQRTTEYLTQEMTVGMYKVQVVKEMAQGGFSTVYLARDTRTRETLALKRMLCQERDSTEAAFQEVKVLRTVRHRNVIALLDQVSVASKTHPGAREFLLLFPYYERGTVWDAIVRATEDGGPWPYPEPSALRAFLDACRGVNAMHSHGYAHRDMKPLNLLVAEDGTCVVMDVGSACPSRREVPTRRDALLLEDEASVVCSAPYRPPELMSVQIGAVIDDRVDVWSLGCTLYAMAFGHSPFETSREGVMKLAILNGKFSFPRGRRHGGCEFSEAFCELISWTLNPDPSSRPRCSEVITRVQGLVARR